MEQRLEQFLVAVQNRFAELHANYKPAPGNFFAKLDVVTEVLLLIAGWTFLFTFVRFFVLPKRSYDFCNRVVSVVHCLIVLPIALHTLDPRDPLKNVGGRSTREEAQILEFCGAYFIYDLIICLLDASTRDVSMCVHHFVTLLGVIWGLKAQTDGNEMVVCLALVEVSNPCMHAREFIKELGLTGSSVEMANNLLFAATFTIARVVFGPYLTYKTLASPRPPLPIKIGAAGVQVVSTYWWYLIARMVYFKLTKGSARKVKKT